MPTMWSNDRIFYAAGKDALKEPEAPAPSQAKAEPIKTAGEKPETEKREPPPKESLRGLIGRILDPHLLPEDDEDIRSPVSRR